MVSKRSKKTSYSIDFPDGPRPVKRNERPISKYYAQLDGGEKSVLFIDDPIESNQQTGVRF
jgi:hypothetical protein